MTRHRDELPEAATDALDRRLRSAASALAGEPLPAELLEAEWLDPPGHAGWALRAASMTGAAVLIGVAVIIGMDQLGRTGVEQPSPTTTVPASTPAPSAPGPTGEPTPPPSESPAASDHPLLVSPSGICADGEAGFSIFLPDGWYANRRFGDSPPCRTLGPAPAVTAQSSDGGAWLSVVATEPSFESPESHDRVELQNGVVLDRFKLVTPEQGAVAAERAITYIARLVGSDGQAGRWLVAGVDADDEVALERLDQTMHRLEIFPPMEINPAAAAEAAALFEDRDYCTITDRDITVVFPDAWWTNTATDGLAPCTFYAPASFEVPAVGSPPAGGLISVTIHDSDYGTFEPTPWWDSTTVGGRPATRWEIVPQGGTAQPAYQYIVTLGDTSEQGPNLVASTTARSPEEYELGKAVLDELMRQIALVGPPPRATSSFPDIEGAPLMTSDAFGEFVLDIGVESARVRAGQPIFVNATLRYIGADDVAVVSGSGYGMTAIGVTQTDGPIGLGGGETADCAKHAISRDSGLRVEGKSGGFDGADPLTPFYEVFFKDPLLRLPPGTYEIGARAHFFTGSSCSSDSEVVLGASVTVVVEP